MKPNKFYLALTVLVLLSINCKAVSQIGAATPTSPAQDELPAANPVATPRFDAGSTTVSEKDSAVLVYIPAGKFMMGGTAADALSECEKHRSGLCDTVDFSDEQPAHEVELSAFWIDQTEVTNEMYEKCVNDGVCEIADFLENKSFTHQDYFANPEYYQYPFLNGSWTYAKTYCEWAGRRLPTEAEWEKAARGTDGRIYPWGNEFKGTEANICDVNCPVDIAENVYNDGYVDVSPVGSYPAGKSFYGVLDMGGNVREWVSDWYDKNYYQNSPTKDPQGPESGLYRSMRGGSWVNTADEARTARRLGDVGGQHYTSVGFRCAISESDLVVRDAAVLPNDSSSSAITIQTKISGQDGATLVFVPEGEFVMGVGEASSQDNSPAHPVYLDAFWMDETEVTNALYAQCVKARGCKKPQDTSSSSRSSYYGNPEFDQYPVIYVEWEMAKEYCEWAGRRLPTEAEWEKTARGTDGRPYPWGEDDPGNTMNYALMKGDTVAVKSYENGKSPYGAYDMAGNVYEWVNDWYDYEYYKNSPASNPQGPQEGRPPARVLRGGSWIEDGFFQLTTTRMFRVDKLINVGFRCAVSDTGQDNSSAGQSQSQTCETGMVISSKDTSKGMELNICSFGKEYQVPGLAQGGYAAGPNGIFFVYVSNRGDVYASRAGAKTMSKIGSVSDFYIIQQREIPEFKITFSGNHPAYIVTIEETQSNQKQTFDIPKSISAP